MNTRRLVTMFAVIAAMLAASLAVSAPASAATQLSNPSVATTVTCGGAKVYVQVSWSGDSSATVYWRLSDTASDNHRPMLRIRGHEANHDATS